jgi:non-homologous end joining protein Ku
MKVLPVKPRTISAPTPVIDLMAALKRSLAREAPADGGKASTEARTKAVPDRRQP